MPGPAIHGRAGGPSSWLAKSFGLEKFLLASASKEVSRPGFALLALAFHGSPGFRRSASVPHERLTLAQAILKDSAGGLWPDAGSLLSPAVEARPRTAPKKSASTHFAAGELVRLQSRLGPRLRRSLPLLELG